MIIIDVIDINRETLNRLCYALIPCTVINRRVQVVHPRWVGFGFGLLSENRGIQQDVGDIFEFVVLHKDFISVAEYSDIHWRRWNINGVVKAPHAGNYPNLEIHQPEIISIVAK